MRWAVAAGVVLGAVLGGYERAIDELVGVPVVTVHRLKRAAESEQVLATDPAEAPARRAEVHAASAGPRVVPIAGDLDVYVVDAARAGAPPIVYLTGSCTHPLASMTAFQRAGAAHGGIVALQGDLPCKGDGTLRRWSPDAVLTSSRIDAALNAAGAGSITDLTLVGYSQGAERAEWLAHRFPAKYTRFVLMAGPVVPAPARFAGARGVATLAGHGDVRETMADGARRLRRASIPALYLEVPGTQHGELSPQIDAFVGQALDWLDDRAPRTRDPHGRGVGAARRDALR